MHDECSDCRRLKAKTVGRVRYRLKRSQGGKHTVENGVALCQECHEHVELHPAEATREGWSVQRGKVAQA